MGSPLIQWASPLYNGQIPYTSSVAVLWLEHGYSIYVAETKHESKSIDTIEDYQYILSNISKFIHE